MNERRVLIGGVGSMRELSLDELELRLGDNEGPTPVATLEKVCEMMADVYSGVVVKTRRYHLRKYRMCFIGSETVDWMVEALGITREQAVLLGQRMCQRKIFHHVTDDHDFKDSYLYYRFRADDSDVTTTLNTLRQFEGEARAAAEVAEQLRAHISAVYNKFVTANGRGVYYAVLPSSPEFQQFVEATEELQRAEIGTLTNDEKVAFFINIYNAMVIHGRIVRGMPQGKWGRVQFFSRVSYCIGGLRYTLNDIEHGILRGNRKHPYGFRRQFSGANPRRFHSVTTRDPRIHFALVCGSRSCPPINVYNANNVQSALTAATQSYLSDGAALAVEEQGNERFVVTLAKLFKWYRCDFGTTDSEVVRWCIPFAPPEKRLLLESAVHKGASLVVRYNPYDWSANSCV